MIADSHYPNAVSISWTECSVAVPKQAMRRFIPGKASLIWQASHAAVGLDATLILTSLLRA